MDKSVFCRCYNASASRGNTSPDPPLGLPLDPAGEQGWTGDFRPQDPLLSTPRKKLIKSSTAWVRLQQMQIRRYVRSGAAEPVEIHWRTPPPPFAWHAAA